MSPHVAFRTHFDTDETGKWGYAIPLLDLQGTGYTSLEKAAKAAHKAVEAVLRDGSPQLARMLAAEPERAADG